jgi:DNA-binding MarR family transcriptional regulator
MQPIAEATVANSFICMTIETQAIAHMQHRLIHEIYVLLDDGDRRALETTQLAPLEFAVLQQLNLEHGRRLTDVGADLLCVKSTITRLVDRLEADGLVLRTPDPLDRRAQRLLLTQKGDLVLRSALSLHTAAVERRMACLSTDEQTSLYDLLEKLQAGLRADLVAGRD